MSIQDLVVPSKGVIVSFPEIERICRDALLPDVWARIAADPPARPFKSDGCTSFPDSVGGIRLYPACFLHDLKYWCGYPVLNDTEDRARFVADAELMIDVVRLGARPELAHLMFTGVRLGGGPLAFHPFSWGFGRT